MCPTINTKSSSITLRTRKRNSVLQNAVVNEPEESSDDSDYTLNETSNESSGNVSVNACLVCQLAAQKSSPDTIECNECENIYHMACLKFTDTMKRACVMYDWRCVECKICSSCCQMNDSDILFCDDCDRGFHASCLPKQLENIPDNWFCMLCK
ncbi:MAG: hypothetical protein MHMPM18_000959 [Marteilia pararefringens]